jgi:hypothetical protein
VAGASQAQFGGAGGMGGMRHGRNGEAQGAKNNESGAASGPTRAEQLTNGLYDARIRLLITPEQAPAWENFYARFTQLANVTPRSASSAEQSSALLAMQSQLSIAQNRYAMTESLSDALKAVYSSLSPEQQRAADDALPRLLRDLGSDAAGRPSGRSRSP